MNDAHQSGFKISICSQIFSDDMGDSRTGTLERWQVTGRQEISSEDAATFLARVNAAKQSYQVETIPAAQYRDLIVFASDGNVQYAVARLDFNAYCRISRMVVDKNNAILIDLANEANFVFVNNSELWNALESLTNKKVAPGSVQNNRR